MHTKGGKSQTERREGVQTCATAQSEWQVLCYRMGDVLLMSRPQISVFVGWEVVFTQCLGDSDQSYRHVVEVTQSPQQPDDRTHSVKG